MTGTSNGWETFKLYNGAVELGFDKNGKQTGYRHSYWLRVPKSDVCPLGRKMVPGVTGISGLLTEAAAGLSPWAAWCAVKYLRDEAKMAISKEVGDLAITAHTRTRDAAAVRGTSVHKYVERIIGSDPTITPEEKKKAAYKYALNTVRFLDKEKIEVVGCEQRVYSRANQYCGTTDIDARMADGARCIIADVKTSKAFRAAHAMQIAAYAYARQEEFPDVVYDDAAVILAGPHVELKWLSHAMELPGREALANAHNAFLGLLAVRTSMPNLRTFGQAKQ